MLLNIKASTPLPTNQTNYYYMEEHISKKISIHEHQGDNKEQNYSKLVSLNNFGHMNHGQVSGHDHHQRYVLQPSSLTTVMSSSPHANYHHTVLSNNNNNILDHHASHAPLKFASSSTVDILPPLSSSSTTTTTNSNNIHSRTFNFQSNSSDTNSKEESQQFIVDYMFKENAGIKKSKKIKRKYEFKRKDGTVSNINEKPQHVRVSYIIMEENELNSCGTINEAIEKHLNANETCFNYSNDQQVSIVKIDSNIKHARKRTVDNITTNEMIRILHLTQQQACTLLGCSLSTIKRKFYSIRNELGIEKWPHNYLEHQNCSFFDNFYPMSLKFILNDEDS